MKSKLIKNDPTSDLTRHVLMTQNTCKWCSRPNTTPPPGLRLPRLRQGALI